MLMGTVRYRKRCLKTGNTTTGRAHPFLASGSPGSDAEQAMGATRPKATLLRQKMPGDKVWCRKNGSNEL